MAVEEVIIGNDRLILGDGVAFHVPGQPQGKQRARIGKVGSFARMFTPAETVAYEGLIAHAASAAMGEHPPFEGPCLIELDVICTVPASWSQRKQAQALAGHIRPTTKPDADNVLKAACDGVNGVVWRDDVQAVEVRLSKRYGAIPGLSVRVGMVGSLAQTKPAQGLQSPYANEPDDCYVRITE